MHQYIGRSLGGYQVVEQIGQGGMATVFKAYQPSMDRYVAIKILASHFTADETFAARFTREARTLARLEHPHILPVHDYGEQDGLAYLVMRYCEAGTLKDLISPDQPMPLEGVVRILSQVASALDYAHSQGVVHRDIKPSNILIDQRGDVFLTDFGIAKLVVESAQFTATGGIVGTPAYMAPEQALGKPVDHRCDIYALGVVLYELVTGQVPYEAETPLAVLLKHANDPLPLLRHIKPNLPPALERVILKAMAKSPDDRFQSAQEMCDALAQAVTEAPTEVLPPPRPTGYQAATQVARDAASSVAAARAAPEGREAASPARRGRRWPIVVAAAVLVSLLAVAGGFLLWQQLGGEAAPPAPSQTARVATSAAQATPTAEGSPGAVPPPATDGQAEAAPEWTTYRNSNFVYALVRQGDTLWAGGDGGLVRWSLEDGSHAEFELSDKLTSGRIHDLLVDQEDTLWIATDAGIDRYDGETLVAYGEEDGLDASWIQTLFQDETGGLWAGSHGGERGLNFFDGAAWGPPPIPALPVEFPAVQAMDGSERYGLFVGLEGQGLAHFDGEGWRVLTPADGLAGDAVLDVLLTDDVLWVSSDPGVVRFDLETGDVGTILPEGGIHTMLQAADGALWFGGAWRVLRFDPTTGDWTEFETEPGPIPAWLVTDMVEAERGLWFGTYGGGLAVYDGTTWETWSSSAELGGNLIEAIRRDSLGGIWFTHPGSGLSRYDPELETWQVFVEEDGALDWPSLPGVDSQGRLWIGDYGELRFYDGQGWQRFKPTELEDVSIYAIEIGPGDVKWIVTDQGLKRHDPASDEWSTFTEADHPILGDIWALCTSGDGQLWVGGEEGIVLYDGATWGPPEAVGGAPRSVDDIAEAADGTLWLAADGELVHLADGRWSYFTWPSEGWLETLAVGPDDHVWAGYEGLAQFDPSSGTWQFYSRDDGLVHWRVRAIHVTPAGVVWVGTEGGVSRFVPPD